MIIRNIDTVPLQEVKMEGASKVQVRIVLGPADKAPTFAMRVFELEPGGHTPLHSHPFEHEAFILEGSIGAVSEKDTRRLAVNDALLIYPGELHQFRNLSETEPARFICLVPVEYQG